MKISTKRFKRLIKEELFYREFYKKLNEEREYDPAQDKAAHKLLMDAGFKRDGSAGKAGGGPVSWQLYPPRAAEGVKAWIQAAQDLNSGLDAATQLMGEYLEDNPPPEDGPDEAYLKGVRKEFSAAFWGPFKAAMDAHYKLGASDTEPRNVGIEQLERRVKGMLGLDPDDYSVDLWEG